MAGSQKERSLSYPSLLSIIKNIDYDKRLKLAVLCPEFRKVHKRIGYSLNSLTFIQKYGDVDEDGIPEEVGSAQLNVESIEYHFIHDLVTNKVGVKCSLTPGNKFYFEEISIARRYFQHFLTTSERPVRRLYLTESDRPFRNLAGLQILDIKWRLCGPREFPLFQNFPQNYIFDKLEFSDYNSILLTENQVRNCKHLILNKEEIHDEYVIGNEERGVRDYYCALKNSKLELHLGLNHVESFLQLCEHILLDVFEIGSSFTASFRKSSFLKDYLWSSLLERFEHAQKGVLKHGECVVLQLRNDCVIAVFPNYYSADSNYRETFTVIKTKRYLDCETEHFA